MSGTPGSHRSPVAGQSPPAAVEQAAQQRRFGVLLDQRVMPNPMTSALSGLAIAVVCFALLYGVSAVAASMDPFGFLYSIVRIVGLLFFFAGFAAVVFAIRQLIVGPRSYWAYADGLVHQRRKRVEAVSWADSGGLRPVIGTKGDTSGKVLHYNLINDNGRPIPIPLQIENGRDPFMDVMIAEMQRRGKPVE